MLTTSKITSIEQKRETYPQFKSNHVRKSSSQSYGNVVPFKHYLPIQDIDGYSNENKELAYGWTELIPVLNALSKVFYIEKNDPVSKILFESNKQQKEYSFGKSELA